MKIYREESLACFEFWSGAKDTAAMLNSDEMDIIEDILEDIYPDGMDETNINDTFWFEPDTIAEWLGYDSWEALEEAKQADD